MNIKRRILSGYIKNYVLHKICVPLLFQWISIDIYIQNMIIYFYYYTFLMIDNIVWVLTVVQLIILTWDNLHNKCE